MSIILKRRVSAFCFQSIDNVTGDVKSALPWRLFKQGSIESMMNKRGIIVFLATNVRRILTAPP